MKFKEYNEYRDKLCDPLVSGYLGALGCDIFSPECWIVDEKIEEQQLDHVIDSWTGQIGDGYIFHSYRYTLNFVQTWLRDNYDIHVFVGWKQIAEKWYSFYSNLYANKEEYEKKREEGIKREEYDNYEEALESGIKSALLKLLKDKFNYS